MKNLYATLIPTLCALVLILPEMGMAQTHALSADGRFVISHDLAKIVIGERQQETVRAFVDIKAFVVGNAPSPDQDKLRTLATDLLRSRVQLVARKDEANLFVQILAYQMMNYAVRNPKQEPAKGFILVAVCKNPITEVAADCDDETYYYFSDYAPADALENVFGLWLDSVFPRVVR